MDVITINITLVKLSNKKEKDTDKLFISNQVNKLIKTIVCDKTIS